MRKIIITEEQREAIMTDYIMGTTYRQLEKKYGIGRSTLHSVVRKYREDNMEKPDDKANWEFSLRRLETQEIKRLEQELRKVNMHNELLNAMIDEASAQLKIDIRKKSGAKQ
jgi:transposase-like protein